MTDHSLETSSLLQTQTKLIHLFYLHFTISWDQFTRNEWKREMEWSCQKLRRVEKNQLLLTCVDSLFFMRTVAHVPTFAQEKLFTLFCPSICHALICDECIFTKTNFFDRHISKFRQTISWLFVGNFLWSRSYPND